MNESSERDPLHLALEVRPQDFGSAPAGRIREPIVEPLWSGLRVIAATRGDDAVLLDDGEPLDGHERIRWHLATMLATTSDGVVVDGYLTKQIASDAGIYTGLDELPSTGRMIAQSMVGIRRNRTEEASKRLEAFTASRSFAPDDVVNLVITDLLWLDGEWLLDIPLLERKRLLEAIVPGTELVRAGAYVRPPVATWIGSWRAQGFAGITFKEANSRYRPGTRASDWASSSMPRR
ncbi:MAG: hypothetical protein ABIQ58_06855 [Candidatus Limnocylindrales bacterium]